MRNEDSVIGVIPHDLKPRELSGASIGKLETVDNMHQRKVSHMLKFASLFALQPSLQRLQSDSNHDLTQFRACESCFVFILT